MRAGGRPFRLHGDVLRALRRADGGLRLWGFIVRRPGLQRQHLEGQLLPTHTRTHTPTNTKTDRQR